MKAIVVNKTCDIAKETEITVSPFLIHFEVDDKWVIIDGSDLLNIQSEMNLKWKEHQVENAIKFKLDLMKSKV